MPDYKINIFFIVHNLRLRRHELLSRKTNFKCFLIFREF